MPSATLLLPPRSRFAGEALPPTVAKALGRADALNGVAGPPSLFEIQPRGWPAAAVVRQAERGDAAGAQWVRADPAYVRPDINGARLLAIGGALGLDEASAESLLGALRPVFDDFGMPIEATAPSRWYLRVDPAAPLPRFADPDDALGADLFDHLPPGDVGRRWRALLSDAQVTLHQHPLNADRASRGLAPVNSVWFWGAGRLPDQVRTSFDEIVSDDEVTVSFAQLAGTGHGSLPERFTGTLVDRVAFDLRRHRRLDALCADWLTPATGALERGELSTLDLVFDDGARYVLRRSQRLRFWRRPLRALVERDAQ